EFGVFDLARGDVSVYFEHGERLAGGVATDSPAAGDDDDAAVALRVGELAFPISGGGQLGFDFLKRLGEFGFKQLMGDAAARFLRFPSVEKLGAAIPEGDLAVEAADEHGVVRKFEKLGLLAVVGFAGAEIEFDIAALEDFLLQGGVGGGPL